MTTKIDLRRFTVALLVVTALGACSSKGTTKTTAGTTVTTSTTVPATTTTVATLPAGALPNAALTPGLADPAVTQANIRLTICVAGYAAKARAGFRNASTVKKERLAAYGLSTSDTASFELDHLISLELGGSPSQVENLWPERFERAGAPAGFGAESKDRVENFLHTQVCSGAMTLADAQHGEATDWTAFEKGAGPGAGADDGDAIPPDTTTTVAPTPQHVTPATPPARSGRG